MKRSRRRYRRTPAYLFFEETYVIDQKRAAELLGVSPRVLAAWRRRGKGPLHMKFGRHVRYSLDDLYNFLVNRSTPSSES